MIEKYAVIVAGGSGTRMGKSTPKQFIPINDYPILMHTIQAFKAVDNNIQIVLVLPEDQRPLWQDLCEAYAFKTPHTLVNGGETRFHSVKNGISTINNVFALVAIHDGVRPFVNSNTIVESFNSAEHQGSGVAAVKLKDSIRKIENGRNEQVIRDNYVTIQTPQTFQQNILIESFKQDYSPAFTDDASVVEAKGYAIHLIDGSYENIKITTPEDLIFAEAYLKSQK